MGVILIIKTRDLFPDFVGFVSDINLKEILSDTLIRELDTAVNKYAVLVLQVMCASLLSIHYLISPAKSAAKAPDNHPVAQAIRTGGLS